MSNINLIVNDENNITVAVTPPADFNLVVDNGRQGPPGAGVPTGGNVGQVLAKKSGANYDTEWITSGALPEISTGVGVPTAQPQSSPALYIQQSDPEVLWSWVNNGPWAIVQTGGTANLYGTDIPTAALGENNQFYIQQQPNTADVLWWKDPATSTWVRVGGSSTGATALYQLTDVNVQENPTYTQGTIPPAVSITTITDGFIDFNQSWNIASSFSPALAVGDKISATNGGQTVSVTFVPPVGSLGSSIGVSDSVAAASIWSNGSGGYVHTIWRASGSSVQDGQALTWDATTSKWVARTVQTTTTNTLSSSGNVMTSNVNGVSSQTPIITSAPTITQPSTNNIQISVNGQTSAEATLVQSVSNTIANNQLTTTVNGVASSPVSIPSQGITSVGSPQGTIFVTVAGESVGVDIAQQGAVNGQVLTWNNSSNKYVPETPSTGTDIDPYYNVVVTATRGAGSTSIPITSPTGYVFAQGATIDIGKAGIYTVAAGTTATNLNITTALTATVATDDPVFLHNDISALLINIDSNSPLILEPSGDGSYQVLGLDHTKTAQFIQTEIDTEVDKTQLSYNPSTDTLSLLGTAGQTIGQAHLPIGDTLIKAQPITGGGWESTGLNMPNPLGPGLFSQFNLPGNLTGNPLFANGNRIAYGSQGQGDNTIVSTTFEQLLNRTTLVINNQWDSAAAQGQPVYIYGTIADQTAQVALIDFSNFGGTWDSNTRTYTPAGGGGSALAVAVDGNVLTGATEINFADSASVSFAATGPVSGAYTITATSAGITAAEATQIADTEISDNIGSVQQTSFIQTPWPASVRSKAGNDGQLTYSSVFNNYNFFQLTGTGFDQADVDQLNQLTDLYFVNLSGAVILHLHSDNPAWFLANSGSIIQQNNYAVVSGTDTALRAWVAEEDRGVTLTNPGETNSDYRITNLTTMNNGMRRSLTSTAQGFVFQPAPALEVQNLAGALAFGANPAGVYADGAIGSSSLYIRNQVAPVSAVASTIGFNGGYNGYIAFSTPPTGIADQTIVRVVFAGDAQSAPWYGVGTYSTSGEQADGVRFSTTSNIATRAIGYTVSVETMYLVNSGSSLSFSGNGIAGDVTPTEVTLGEGLQGSFANGVLTMTSTAGGGGSVVNTPNIVVTFNSNTEVVSVIDTAFSQFAGADYLNIVFNGRVLRPTTDYTLSGTTVSFNNLYAFAGDVIQIQATNEGYQPPTANRFAEYRCTTVTQLSQNTAQRITWDTLDTTAIPNLVQVAGTSGSLFQNTGTTTRYFQVNFSATLTGLADNVEVDFWIQDDNSTSASGTTRRGHKGYRVQGAGSIIDTTSYTVKVAPQGYFGCWIYVGANGATWSNNADVNVLGNSVGYQTKLAINEVNI